MINYRQLFEKIRREKALDRAVVVEVSGEYFQVDLKVESHLEGHGITLVPDSVPFLRNPK